MIIYKFNGLTADNKLAYYISNVVNVGTLISLNQALFEIPCITVQRINCSVLLQIMPQFKITVAHPLKKKKKKTWPWQIFNFSVVQRKLAIDKNKTKTYSQDKNLSHF